ncbi:MAG: endonuclease domain-containing protein [Bacteroidetes bacterium]|nr:endonuclease domain-containing protein [Bacteroidota bacterium]
MKESQIHNRKELEEVRRLLRKTLTPAEATMWKALQKSKLDGRKFRRQHSVEDYILDFYCPSEKLAIELDGMPHFSIIGAKQDIKRDKYLNSLSIQVLRFENRDIYNNLRGVLGFIMDNFKRNK